MEETGVSKGAPVSFYQHRPSLLTMLTRGGFRFYRGGVLLLAIPLLQNQGD